MPIPVHLTNTECCGGIWLSARAASPAIHPGAFKATDVGRICGSAVVKRLDHQLRNTRVAFSSNVRLGSLNRDCLLTIQTMRALQAAPLNTVRGERRMNVQNNRKSTVSPHHHRSRPHEFLAASILGQDGFYEHKEAVSLSELRSALESSGNSIAISDYLAYEAMLRDDYAKHLAELDSREFPDDSASNGYEETEEYKKGHAEFLLLRDLNQTLYWCRERLMKTAEAV
jgi:hypothetical protein